MKDPVVRKKLKKTRLETEAWFKAMDKKVYGPIADTRKFNGKEYRILNSGPSKLQEKKMAEKYRERDYSVRLVKSGDKWVAYGRKK